MSRNVLLIALVGLISATLAGAADHVVPLKSGDVKPVAVGDPQSPQAADARRFVVRFKNPTGMVERGRLSKVGARIEAPLPNNAYLVTVPQGRQGELAAVTGIDWVTAYRAEHKISPDIVDAAPVEGAESVLVLLHLFKDADVQAVADELTLSGLEVQGVGSGSRFDRIVLSMDEGQVASWRETLAARDDVYWVGRRYRRTLLNDTVVWVDQSGLEAGMTTPIHDAGLHGEGQIAAVLDTGIDADACYFRDGTLGLPPTNTGAGTTVDTNQRKVIAVDFLDPTENPADPTHWDTQGHGSHVAGTLVGDDLANPVVHDSGDGMAPAAQVVIQDAGYAADDCGDLPGIGCPVTDLVPIFQQAYDQGARVHNNSWGDNENAAVTNTYSDASEDADEFIWNNPDFLITFGAGNSALGGYETVFSPSTCKNGLSVGGTYAGEFAMYLSDISVWGPTDDGRMKPDILSPGASIQSASNDTDVTTNNCATRSSTGTSHASPGAAGSALLLRQYFLEGWYPSGSPNAPDGFTPTAALLKAMILNSGVSIEFDAEGREVEYPDEKQGWGRILLDNSMHFNGETRGLYIDEHAGLASPTDPPVTYLVEVLDVSEPLKVTLVWTDYPSTPAAAMHLVNDLDLRVDGVTGGFWGNSFKFNESWPLFGVDRLNNVEQVLINAPTPGVYSIQVSAHAVPQGPQPFSLVVTGAISVSSGPRPGYLSHVVDDSGPNGNGDGILDPGETAILPVTVRNSGDSAATSVSGEMYGVGPLKVYQANATYPDVAQNQQQTSNAPHYEVTLDPTASCGDWVGANMALSGAGFTVGSGFTMDVGVYDGDRPSTDTPVTVPKSSPAGVWSYLTVPDDFIPTDFAITFNLDHEDLSQVRVVLYHPDNSLVFLHDFGPGSTGIHTTFDENNPPANGTFDTFLGKSPAGTWRVKVIDDDGCCGVPDGTLQDWTLHFTSDVPWECNPVSCGEAVPPAVGDTLTVDKSGASDVQVSWTGVGGASNYNVWRAHDPQMGTAVHLGATGGSTSFVDGGARNLSGIHYYVARSVNSCRWESN